MLSMKPPSSLVVIAAVPSPPAGTRDGFPATPTISQRTTSAYRRLGSSVAIKMIRRAFGTWTSPLNAGTLSEGNCKQLCELRTGNDGVFWIEQTLPSGKRVIVRPDSSKLGNVRHVTSESFNVRNCVHEYGGGSLAVGDGFVYFTTVDGIFRKSVIDEGNSESEQRITNPDKHARYADLEYFQGKIYCVQEKYAENSSSEPENRLVAISVTDGKTDIIASNADFFASPRVSPDGGKIAWIQWNHPNMPWDATSIWVDELNGSNSSSPKQILGDGQTNFAYPQWSRDSQLFVIADATNWWNIYRVDIDNGKLAKNVHVVNAECGGPHWQFGETYYTFLKDNGLLFTINGKLMHKTGNSTPAPIETGFTRHRHLSLNVNGIAYCIATAPNRPESLLRIELNGDQKASVSVLREVRDIASLNSTISMPQLHSFPSDGVVVSGFFYPPCDEKPPVVLFLHGGPTAEASDSLDLKKQFFTSRGFAVFDINYRGSSGFGRKFRDLLYGQWGIVDRDDLINGAKYLIDANLVDAQRVCIMGGSAGGYLLLSALVHSPIFAAAVCLYGIGDLKDLVKHTGPKFESRYEGRLIGSTEDAVLDSRSPVNFTDKIVTPTIFLHGTADTVVDSKQSIAMHDALKRRGVQTELVLFEGEGHGFRGADAIVRSIELPYQFLCRALRITSNAATH